MNPEVYIQAENLSKKYENHSALSPVNFSISKNELFGFIGPDGAGKTSLFRILTTLLLPDSGWVRIGKYDVVRDFREIRQQIGYMPGRFSLYPDLSVEENLQFFATVFGTSIKENYSLIEPVYKYIEPFRKRLAGRLSGGMKQKLALSCALIHYPQLLVLDEPTTGVDAVSRKEFWDMLKTLKNKGITIIVSTPYMDEASLCDRIALMQEGSILSIGTPEEITGKFRFELFKINTTDTYGTISALKRWGKARSAKAFGHSVHLTLQAGVGYLELKDWCNSFGFSANSLSKTKAGIEDCFMELVESKQATQV